MDDVRGFFEEYRFLSNFWPCKVSYGGVVFSTVENAYQAAKCANPHDIAPFAALTPAEAKKRGGEIALRADWNEVRVVVMADLLAQKFSDPALRAGLLQTGTAQLVEDNTWDDRFWGVCGGQGENNLGKLLMQLRAHLAAQQAAPVRKPPARG